MTHSFTYSSLGSNVIFPQALIRDPLFPSLSIPPPTTLCVVLALTPTRPSIMYLLVYFLSVFPTSMVAS